MREEYIHRSADAEGFFGKLLYWSKSYDRACLLDSNSSKRDSTEHLYPRYDIIAGIGCNDELVCNEYSLSDVRGCATKNNDKVGCFAEFKRFRRAHKDWMLGFMTYDLKNELEELSSDNKDYIGMPALSFFVPKYVFVKEGDRVFLYCEKKDYREGIFEEVENTDILGESCVADLQPRISREEYLDTIDRIKGNIRRGDIYEVNFCQEYYDDRAEINPYDVYCKLKGVSPVPFGAFYRLGDKYLMCASPERFLKKMGATLISQPIKGTAPRGVSAEEDRAITDELKTNPKERAENIMITDLVRNDLSRRAAKGSVRVEELCGVYTYPQVHQMISTVMAELKEGEDWIDAVADCWPMGSMTGAPKVSAMKLIERYECTKRGLYSGSVGYITPDDDFDFNVIIRSLIYNQTASYLSCIFGGAITMQSVAEKEYEECLIKAKAIKEVFAQ